MRTCHHCHKEIMYKSKNDGKFRMNVKKVIFDESLVKAMGICSNCKKPTPIPLYLSKVFKKEVLYINDK